MIEMLRTVKGRYRDFHSFDDKPAGVYSDGEKYWYIQGKYHRIDQPQDMRINRWKEWMQEDEYFNNQGPCSITTRRSTYSLYDLYTVSPNWQNFNYD